MVPSALNERALSRSRRARGAVAVVAALGVSALAWAPMLDAFPRTQGGDGPVFQKALEAALVSVVRYKELPLWNPYECGGIPLWDNPQSPVGAPLVWTMVLFGTTFAMALSYVVHTAAGLLAMALFARRELALSRATSALTGCAWAFAGVHAQHYGGGHFAFLPFLYIPIAVYAWRRAEHDDRAAVALGALVALMVYEGAVYPLPHFALFFAAETALRLALPQPSAASRRARLRPIARAAVLVALVAVLLSASRLLPVVDQLAAHTRPLGEETDALSLNTLRDMFLAREHTREVVGQSYVWPEYGAYVGPVVLVFAAIGLLEAGALHAWLVGLFVVAFALMLGHVAAFAPWSLLKGHVFPFREMRVPSRFSFELTFAVVAFAGLGLERLPDVVVRTRRALASPPLRAGLLARRIALVVFAVAVADVLYVGTRTLRKSFPYAPLARVEASPRLFFEGVDMTPNMVLQPSQNRGRLACWDEWGWGYGAPYWEGDVPQARADAGAPSSLRVIAVTRTQNSFVLDVDAQDGGAVRFNSAFDRQWRTTTGMLEPRDRMLVLDLPKLGVGTHRVTVRYAPRLLVPGCMLTLAGLALVSAVFLRARRIGFASGGGPAARDVPQNRML